MREIGLYLLQCLLSFVCHAGKKLRNFRFVFRDLSAYFILILGSTTIVYPKSIPYKMFKILQHVKKFYFPPISITPEVFRILMELQLNYEK